MTLNKRTVTRLKKRVIHSSNWLLAGVLVILVGMTINVNSDSDIDVAAYTPLLNTIARGESGGNYNAHFGNPSNSAIKFTGMTIAEVLQWQSNHVNKGNYSSAVGKYQIIQPTLEELVDTLHIDKDAMFDEDMQDRMAIALLERRGAKEYANDKISREQFASNIAKEWAALPQATGPNPHESYYSSDGLNKSNISVDEVYGALDTLRKTVKDNG